MVEVLGRDQPVGRNRLNLGCERKTVMKYLLLLITLSLLACNPSGPIPSGSPDGSVLHLAAPLGTSGFKVHDPYEGLPIDPRLPNRPNLLKAEYRSPADIEQAGCQAKDGSWACNKVARKLKAPGGTANAVVPSAWTVPAWWFDDANSTGVASDNNNCTSSSSPCLHYYEILRRLGGEGVTFFPTNLVTVFWGMSSQPDSTDTLHIAVQTSGSPLLRSVEFIGTLPTPLCTTTITSFTAKNIPGGAMPSLAVGTCLTGSDLLIVNTTRGSSTAYTNTVVSGNTYNISQPVFTCTAPGTSYNGASCPSGGSSIENNSWSSGDTVSVYVPKTFFVSTITPINSVAILDTMTMPGFVAGGSEFNNNGSVEALEIWRSVTNNFLIDTNGGFTYVLGSNTHGGLQLQGGMEAGFNDNTITLNVGASVGNDQILIGNTITGRGNIFINQGSHGFQGSALYGAVYSNSTTPGAGNATFSESSLYFEYVGNFDFSQPTRQWGPGQIWTQGRGAVTPVLANPDGGPITLAEVMQLTGSVPYNIGFTGVANKACVNTFANPAVLDCTKHITVADMLDAGLCSAGTNNGEFAMFIPGLGSWACGQP